MCNAISQWLFRWPFMGAVKSVHKCISGCLTGVMVSSSSFACSLWGASLTHAAAGRKGVACAPGASLWWRAGPAGRAGRCFQAGKLPDWGVWVWATSGIGVERSTSLEILSPTLLHICGVFLLITSETLPFCKLDLSRICFNILFQA